MKKILVLSLLLLVGIGGYIGYPYYQYSRVKDLHNIKIEGTGKYTIKVDRAVNFSDLGEWLQNEGVVHRSEDIACIVRVKNLGAAVMEPGLKIIELTWDNRTLVNNLYLKRNEDRSILKLVFSNLRNLSSVAGKISHQLEMDSVEVLHYLSDGNLAERYGFTKDHFCTMFLPNTYEVYHNITIDELVAKFAAAYKSFWNSERKAKAAQIGLSQTDVAILASIVYEEQKEKFDEHSKIAGLYINRLKKNWKLESDPTVKFAIGNMGIKRVLYEHLAYDSPYNTYLYPGLPPAPLNIPEATVLDAVLNYEKHDYMFMCAQPTYSGYHNFSKTLRQHNEYAKQYQSWLNTQGIR